MHEPQWSGVRRMTHFDRYEVVMRRSGGSTPPAKEFWKWSTLSVNPLTKVNKSKFSTI